ncbi:MAG: TonB-dependent receptor [Gallionella sp.]|nr:TonB-dependent receptor [Gallionella sp.]
MKYRTKLKFCVIACAAFWICYPASAANKPDVGRDSPASVGVVEDGTHALAAVIVTAERRSQPLRKVPISIAAFTGEDIEKSKIGSIIDVQQHVPGLTVTQASTGQALVFVRGIGTDIVGSGVEDAVAVYIDGVYQSRAAATAMQFVDVDRVEVLKGPQGILYGRNATGGAINIISKAPGAEKSAQFDVQAGSYNQKIVRGTVSGPLYGSSVNGRLSFLHNSDGGDTRNMLLNLRGNSSDVNALRGSLEFMPNDELIVTVNAHHYQNNFTTAFKPLHPAVNPLFTVFGATVIDDPRTVMQNLPNEASLTQSGIDVRAEWDLGAAELASITALHKTDYNIKRADLDGTEIPLLNVGSPMTGIGIPETTSFFSQEFTLASNDNGPLVWTGLLSYTHQKVDAPGFNFSFPLLNLTTDSVATVVTDALGVGGQATYSLPNGLRLTMGARYSTETKNLEKDQTYANGILTGSMTDKKTWSSVTPKFVVDYSPDKSHMLYASATKGFKSGGYNTVAIQPAFSPETAVNYETGIKSRMLDDRLLLNLSAFYTKYNDMQVSIVLGSAGGLYSEIKNAARAVSKGIEASAVLKPTARFELSGGVQLLDARFAEFITIDPQNPALGAADHKDNPLSRAPDVTANLAAQYTWPEAGGALTLRGEGSYRSKIYYTPFKNDYASDAGLTVWNALLNYESSGKTGIYAAAFVKNLSDKTYTRAIFDPQGLGYLAYYAPARTAGIQVGYRY